MIDGFKITEGAEYVYTAALPSKCTGHLYRVLKFVLAVPSYQHVVLVEALTGPDEGLWFTTTINNFATRYQLAPPPVAAEPAPSPDVSDKGPGY